MAEEEELSHAHGYSSHSSSLAKCINDVCNIALNTTGSEYYDNYHNHNFTVTMDTTTNYDVDLDLNFNFILNNNINNSGIDFGEDTRQVDPFRDGFNLTQYNQSHLSTIQSTPNTSIAMLCLMLGSVSNNITTRTRTSSYPNPVFGDLRNVFTMLLSSINCSDDVSDYDEYEYDYTDDDLPMEEVIPVSLLYGITLLVGVIGNLLVIAAVARDRRLRSITNIFLTSLATADLALLCFCVPVKVSASSRIEQNK